MHDARTHTQTHRHTHTDTDTQTHRHTDTHTAVDNLDHIAEWEYAEGLLNLYAQLLNAKQEHRQQRARRHHKQATLQLAHEREGQQDEPESKEAPRMSRIHQWYGHLAEAITRHIRLCVSYVCLHTYM